MTVYKTIATVLAFTILTGCEGTSTFTPEATEFEWQGNLTGSEGFEHLSGVTAFRWVEGTQFITAAIAISGDEPGAVRPWHVHVNSCATGGGIFGADGQYPRLTIGADGTAAAVVEVPVVPALNAQYHVNVHLGDEPDEFSVFIACADLAMNGDPASGGTAAPPPSIPGY